MPTRKGMRGKDKEKLCGIRREIIIFCLYPVHNHIIFCLFRFKMLQTESNAFPLHTVWRKKEILSRRRRGTEEEEAAEETGS